MPFAKQFMIPSIDTDIIFGYPRWQASEEFKDIQ
jgi:hypothetical protein